jgi:hypothetical protein
LLIQLIGLLFIFRISLLDLLAELNDIAINLCYRPHPRFQETTVLAEDGWSRALEPSVLMQVAKWSKSKNESRAGWLYKLFLRLTRKTQWNMSLGPKIKHARAAACMIESISRRKPERNAKLFPLRSIQKSNVKPLSPKLPIIPFRGRMGE